MGSKPLDPDDWMPVIPDLNVKTVDFDIIKRSAQQVIAHELIEDMQNLSVDTFDDFMRNFVVVRLIQRMAAQTADETVITDTETVPANWWSHLIVAIVGGVSVPRGYGWRWKLLKRAKLKQITTRTAYYRVCPHVHIPDNQMHFRWLMNVGEDARLGYLQRGQE
jgi:hypothetical protein